MCWPAAEYSGLLRRRLVPEATHSSCRASWPPYADGTLKNRGWPFCKLQDPCLGTFGMSSRVVMRHFVSSCCGSIKTSPAYITGKNIPQGLSHPAYTSSKLVHSLGAIANYLPTKYANVHQFLSS